MVYRKISHINGKDSFIVNPAHIIYENPNFEYALGGVTGAVKHANGKDWWVLALEAPNFKTDSVYYLDHPGATSVLFYLFEPDKESFTLQNRQNIPQIQKSLFKLKTLTFSPNQKYISLCEYDAVKCNFDDTTNYRQSHYLNIFEMDRCEGKLTHRLDLTAFIPKSSYVSCSAFSPDGKLLYVVSDDSLRQFEIEKLLNSKPVFPKYYAMPLAPKIEKVYNSGWKTIQLGADKKLYVQHLSTQIPGALCFPSFSDTVIKTNKYLGVVNNPNITGAGCTYDPYGLSLNGFMHIATSSYLPVSLYPNYSLGAMPPPTAVSYTHLTLPTSDLV